MKEKLKKLIMDTLKRKPENKALMLMDFSVNVRTTLGVSMNDYIDELLDAAAELEQEELIRFEDGRNGGRFVRGLNFDNYYVSQPDNSTYNFNVGNISAANVQVGNNNTLAIEQGFQELIDKLNELDVPENDKNSAKQTLRSVLSNASIASILGGAVSGLLSLL